ncbi:hypothetical protein GH975_05785 [Litorivicinus lipolyticus]|uniref:Uncharacterized protein n=1 Tax=Litorivicinus lipolyticus TaxID=418701 RepID=A0A5Q2Q6X7_9GAMM|nr:hypothetical protein [Litorivicinus lipolyticus]QGG80109.1 hypothetical protein GH975_05785 [Litorivicinus lipolyticus]
MKHSWLLTVLASLLAITLFMRAVQQSDQQRTPHTQDIIAPSAPIPTPTKP